MKRIDLTALTIEQLFERFAEIGVAQDHALLDGRIAQYNNRLYPQMEAVDTELRARGPGARLALMPLYKHPNVQVRLAVPIRTLGLAPDEAKAQLETISRLKWLPQGPDAGMCRSILDSGVFKPT
jgi:hypothetical protein